MIKRDMKTGRFVSEHEVSKEELNNLYWVKKLSIRQIAEKFGAHHAAILRWMNGYGIPRRKRPDSISLALRSKWPRKEEVENLYIGKWMSAIAISKLYNVSTSTVSRWLRGYEIPKRENSMATSMGRNPCDLVPSPELSYAVGALLGDGCADSYQIKSGGRTYRTYRIRFRVKDFDFAEAVQKALSKLYTKRKRVWLNKRGLYSLTIGSLPLYELLKNRTEYEMVALEYPKDFLRGFFDAEGCVCVKKPRISLCSTREDLIQMVKKCLGKIGIPISSAFTENKKARKPLFTVTLLAWWGNIPKFASEVGSNILRKRERLMQLLECYGS